MRYPKPLEPYNGLGRVVPSARRCRVDSSRHAPTMAEARPGAGIAEAGGCKPGAMVGAKIVFMGLNDRRSAAGARVPGRTRPTGTRVPVGCNGMLAGAPGALLKWPRGEAPARHCSPVHPIRLPEL